MRKLSSEVVLSVTASHTELVFGLYADNGERECCGILDGAKRCQLLSEQQGKRSGCGRKICKKLYYFNIIVHKTTVLCVSFSCKAAELRAYLKSKGAEISEENSEGGLHVDLAQIIEVCDVCLKEDDKGLSLQVLPVLLNIPQLMFSNT